jgi:transposase InsO family protein
LVTITGDDGAPKALVSVVPFLDQDFHFVRCPWPKSRFGQTNYRAYVIDGKTGEHVVWFFGTSLASFLVVVPRVAWKFAVAQCTHSL